MTSANEQKIGDAVVAAEHANSDVERDEYERAAITAWRQIAIDKRLDRILLDRAMRHAGKSELVKEVIKREDLDVFYLGDIEEGRAYAWAVLASLLNDLRVGFLRTKAGEALIHAAKAVSEGRGSWLTKAVKSQGVDATGEWKEAAYFSIVGLAALYDAISGCGVRGAIHYAVTEYGFKAAHLGLQIDPEALRRRVNSAGNAKRSEDRLAAHYRQMFKLMSNPENRAAIVEANTKNTAVSATIRGKTSPHGDE